MHTLKRIRHHLEYVVKTSYVMSVRRVPSSELHPDVSKFQNDLAHLKNASTATAVDVVQTPSSESAVSFDSLTENEKSAASLGVHPESWKPIVRYAPTHVCSRPLTLVHVTTLTYIYVYVCVCCCSGVYECES